MTFLQTITAIAADTLAGAKTNPNGFTVETLVANWIARVEWLGLKVGGKAWEREVLSQAKAGWIATTQDTTTVIPPSEQTLAEGGFLGGEILPNADKRAAAEALFASRF